VDLLVKLKILIVSVLSCLILQALLQEFADLSVFILDFICYWYMNIVWQLYYKQCRNGCLWYCRQTKVSR